MPDLPLPFDGRGSASDVRAVADADLARDQAARARAVDPRCNVVLEASAGTGKTRVLVDRYVNLLRAGVDPANVLAITFTRKAAAEMRERIVASLHAAAERTEIPPSRWRELRARLGEIAISTIDAFCLGLLREFPLEADVDPGFAMADDTDAPLLMADALDRALRTCRAIAREDEHVALAFAHAGDLRLRAGLAALLERRLVAPAAFARSLARMPRDRTAADVVRRGAAALLDLFAAMPGGLDRFLETGPPDAGFLVLGRTLRGLATSAAQDAGPSPPLVQAAFARVRDYCLTQDGRPRARPPYAKAAFASPADWRVHAERVPELGAAFAELAAGYRRDLDLLILRGVQRMFRVAETEYRRTLDAHAVLDFSDVLARTLGLLRHMEEFAQSRYRLESRYHHVLVDEFQDTSRAQWELVSLLVQSWGEGAGVAHTGPLPPSIFIVGDRKQSIYRFRDADVSVLQEARLAIEALRPDRDVRRSISRSFRSVPALLAFVNDVCAEMDASASSGGAPEGAGAATGGARPDAFRYGLEDRFPVPAAGPATGEPRLGVISSDTMQGCAAAVAVEVSRLLGSNGCAADAGRDGAPLTVRDRITGLPRAVRAGDIAVLFRTRDSHRDVEQALETAGIAAYVYKGLGFFDADEVRDVLALVGCLAHPASDLRAAAWLRSRFVRLSDEGLGALAPRIADALSTSEPQDVAARLGPDDARAFAVAREAMARWRRLVDRLPPAELLDRILRDSAYAIEMRGPRLPQARENLKKLRTLIRRMQNRGYLSLSRLSARLERLSVGEEANAVVDAADAVNLMTIHAAKGLEFPVVFLVNLTRGSGSGRDAIRIVGGGGDDVQVAVGDADGEVDAGMAAAEREETKRLLYVALTRARDVLYLGAVRREGRMQPAHGSLAEVLPPSLLALFDTAGGTAAERVDWQAASGAVHAFRVCRAGDGVVASAPAAQGRTINTVSDFGPIAPAPLRVWPVVAMAGAAAATAGGRRSSSDRLRGTLVHRVIHRVGLRDDLADRAIRHQLRALCRADEAADAGDLDALLDEVVSLYRALSTHSHVRPLYESGEVLHEVPFAIRGESGVLRGTIDCLVRQAHRLVVLEFKTGGHRPEHRAQADIYERAARALFPGVPVETRLVYADGTML